MAQLNPVNSIGIIDDLSFNTIFSHFQSKNTNIDGRQSAMKHVHTSRGPFPTEAKVYRDARQFLYCS